METTKLLFFASRLCRTNLRCRVSWLLTLLCYTGRAQASTQQDKTHGSSTCCHVPQLPSGTGFCRPKQTVSACKTCILLALLILPTRILHASQPNCPMLQTALLFSHCVVSVLASIFRLLAKSTYCMSIQSKPASRSLFISLNSQLCSESASA